MTQLYSNRPFRAEDARFMPWSAVALPKNAAIAFWKFLSGPANGRGVSSVFSADGKEWKREPGNRLLDGSRYALESRIAPTMAVRSLPANG